MVIVNECKSKENASDEDAVVVINHDEPTSPTQKCLYACFYETISVVSCSSIFLKIDSKIRVKVILTFAFRSKGIRCQSFH